MLLDFILHSKLFALERRNLYVIRARMALCLRDRVFEFFVFPLEGFNMGSQAHRHSPSDPLSHQYSTEKALCHAK